MSAERYLLTLVIGIAFTLLGGCENATVVSGSNPSQPPPGGQVAQERFCTIVGEQETVEQLETRIREKCRVGDVITNLGYWYALARDPSLDQSAQFQLKRAPALIARFCDMSKQVVIPDGDNFVCYLAAKREVF
jgi:hypothetical protein